MAPTLVPLARKKEAYSATTSRIRSKLDTLYAKENARIDKNNKESYVLTQIRKRFRINARKIVSGLGLIYTFSVLK